ncbi:desmoplakin-A-like [Poeciliopsis prolifica]|uniref:desmoplakin-A-like n=1 Tax=Poeciliopsis prolifica TaxID=188132 RepID=UPI00241382ED|nr:desmoplakin-A-like [Poeciliopsis prolifica]
MSFSGSNQALNSVRRANSRSNLAGGMTYHYARSDVAHGGGNGVEPMVEGFNRSATFSRATMSKGSRMMSNTMGSATMGGMSGYMSTQSKAMQLQARCNEYLQNAEDAIQAGSGDAEDYMIMAKDAIERLKVFAMELNQMGQPSDNVVRSVEYYQDQLRGVHRSISGTSLRRRSTRKSSGGWEEAGRSFHDAIAWIHQQKRLIETTALADDPPSIEQQLINHQRFHASLQGAPEMIRAREDLKKSRDKASQHALEQEWENLQKMSNLWTEQLQELIQILHQITNEIIWVNGKEEEELMFDWGDKNIEQYIPKKQESYSKLMSALEVKEKDLHKLKAKVKTLLKDNHPGSDKIEAYMDTLQTQWSWLLQITKCIDTHLKENAAYSQFFREANDTYKNLQKEHETIRKEYICDKNTPLEDLQKLLKGLEREKENILDNKRQVKHLTVKSKSIVRLKPRNPEERNSPGIIVKALTDFREDQKAILKDNEAILKDNSQRSKWLVTGPGGIDMLIPSVCLIVPPPNPLSISVAKKNEQYFDSIMSIWNQLFINIKSLISWHYCLREINYVNSLTISMLSEMRPEEYRQIMKKLEAFYEEFKISSHGSEVFVDEDKKSIENQFTVAQAHYDKLVVKLPTYTGHQEQIEVQQITEQQVQPQLIFIQQQPQQHQLVLLQQQEQQRQQQVLLLQQQQEKQQQLLLLQQQQQEKQQQLLLQQQQQEKQQQLLLQQREQEKQQQLLLQQQQQEKQQQLLLQQQQQAAAEEEARRQEEERRQAELKRQEHVIKKDVVKVTKTEQRRKVSSSSSFSSASRLLSELHGLRLRMDTTEGSLSQYVHICFGEDGAKDCSLKIIQLESIQDDVSSMRGEYTHLRERILKEMETTNDLDKAQFLRNEIAVMSQKLGNLENSSSAYVLRLRALRDMLESVARAEDIVKVHEARLTEKETTSLSPAEVDEYIEALKNMKAELMQKQDVLTSMESELSKASHWNSQMGGSFHRCDLMLSKFTEQVGLLSDRWRRIQKQIDTRLQDLQLYLPQLQQYKQVYTSFTEWIEATRRKQDALQATKIENVQAVKDHITNQKVLNTEIKAKRETLDSVLKNIHTCVNTIKDYETDLASYTSGLETLLNVPIKRTMLQSPSMDLNKEAIHLQTHYTELLILSGDYYKFLGQLEKSMEELKMRNTQINMLGDQLHSLREEMEASNAKNKSLEEDVAQFKLQLSQSQEQLLSVEAIKQKTVMQCSATKDSLDSTQGELAQLKSEVQRLEYKLDDERRKAKLAEEGYDRQKNDWETVLNQRQKELDMVCRSKKDVEDRLANKEYEIEQLRQKLANESTRLMDLQKEMSKVRSNFSMEINSLKLSYESQIQISRTDIQRLSAQRDENTTELQMQYERMETERRNLEDELRRLRTFISQTEEQKKKVEEELCNQRAILIQDGQQRRELESQVELLIRQRDEERNQYREELAEILKTLEEKSGQLVYVTHSLEEETRRRKTSEEGHVVLEQSLAQLQMELNRFSEAATQLRECEEQLLQTRFQLEREKKERCRMDQNMSRLQGRIKDLQGVRDSLEGQVENLRKTHQEELGKRRQVEAELEKMTLTMTEYTNTITVLRQSQEQASISETRGEKECIQLKEKLEKTLSLNQSFLDQNTQLCAEVKTIKQQLLEEQSRAKEASLQNESLYKTIEEKCKALSENSAELKRLKELIETQTKEELRMKEELRAVRQDKEELLKSKKGIDDELSSQITALELQLQASECSNAEHRNLVSELSSEREKLKLEAEKIQKQVAETQTSLQSLQSKYSEIVSEKDSLSLKLQRFEFDKEQMLRLQEEVNHMKHSHELELRNKQHLQDDIERGKRELIFWKDQCDSKQSLIRQYDTDKDILERDKKSLKSEIERLMKEHRELEEKNKSRLSVIQKQLQDGTIARQTMETELRQAREPPIPDASSVVFDGVRKPVTAKQLLDSGVLDKPTYDQLLKGHKTVPEVSAEKKVPLKGTGPIAGVIIESPKGPGSSNKPLCKLTFTEAKRENLLPPDSIDLLLDAQAATGHIIDPRTNQKLTVKEAYHQGVIDDEDKERLLAAEAAAVGYAGPGKNKPLSVFQAMKQGVIDKNTALRLLQAQESVGGILDPILSVFLPRDIATERNLIDESMCNALNQRPELYLDPETEEGVTYMAMKRRCKIEPHTGLCLLPIPEKVDPSNLVFDGVRKPVTAKHLFDCHVLDKPTFKALENGKKTVPEVSEDKTVNLKGTGPIAGVIVSGQHKMSLTEAKKQMLLSDECADLLLEAQAATGHIIDPKANKKLTVEEAYSKGVVDINDLDRLLASEAAAIGYKDPTKPKPISVFQAMKKGLIDEKTGIRFLQAQESVGGILDPNFSVFLPRDTAIKHNLLDKNLCQVLNQKPEYYVDPETEQKVTYQVLKNSCKIEPHTGLLLLPILEKLDPSKLIFDGVRKPVTAKQLYDCGVLDKPTLNELMKGDKTVPEVSVDKKITLKGTGSIAGVTIGSLGKMNVSEAKKQLLMSPESADLLLEAQAATGHIIDPMTNQKLTVEEACSRGVVDRCDQDKLLVAEAAAVGFTDPHTGKSLSVFEAMKKALIDKKTGVRLLQAQESAGGILDPNLSVFLPKDTAMKRNLLDEDLYQALNKSPKYYLDPDTQQPTTYASLKTKCKSDPSTGLLLLPKPTQLTIRGLRREVSVTDLVDAKLLSKSDVDQLNAGKLTTKAIEDQLRSYLGGSTCIAGVYDEASNKVLSIYQAMKNGLLRPGTTLELLEAQAASGFMIDPVNNLFLTVAEAYNRKLFGPEFKEKLLSAEKAVTGYKMPVTGEIVSLFQAIENGLVEKGHGIRLLEAQIASGGIIDPKHSHRIDVNVAYQRGYFNEEMNKILTDESDDTKGFFDPNTEKNLTYLELKKHCISDKNTGLILLPIKDKKKQESSKKNTVRKRRVIIVDPETDKEMTVREAYNKGYIDYDTYLELSEQECEWEEITITAPDGSIRFAINDRSTGKKYDVTDLLEKRVIDQSVVEQYRSQAITITEFADIISNQATHKSASSSSVSSSNVIPEPSGRSSVTSSSLSSMLSTSGTSASLSSSSVTSSNSKTSVVPVPSITSSSSSFSSSTVVSRPLSPTFTKTTTTKTTTIIEKSSSSTIVAEKCSDSMKQGSHISITLSSPLEPVGEVEPVGAVFDTEAVEKVSITEALNRGLVDSITAQRLLEAQACTGGIVNPTDGKRVSIQEASQIGLIANDMVTKLKPAQKAYFGFEDIKTKRKLSAALAIKEMWLPYEAGQRFLEFQVATGGLYDPEKGCRRSIEDALKMGWLDSRTAQKLLDVKNHTKNLTCPKSKLRISYKEVLDNCLVEEGTGVKMLQASSVSSRGISSPYNIASAPGSKTGSRSGSQRGSRRSSLDLGSSLTQYNFTSFTSFSSTR